MTNGQPAIVKKLNFANADEKKLIRAHVREAGSDRFYPMSFPADQVDGVVGISEGVSAMILRTGVKIVVAMAHIELEEKIYRRYEPIIDLRELTGDGVKNITAPQLSTDFDAAAKKGEASGLRFVAILRESGSDKFVISEFYESDVYAFEPIDSKRSRSGKSIRIIFNRAASDGPFNSGEALLDMSHEAFISYLNQAKSAKSEVCDLRRVFENYPQYYGLKN